MWSISVGSKPYYVLFKSMTIQQLKNKLIKNLVTFEDLKIIPFFLNDHALYSNFHCYVSATALPPN